MIRVLEPLISFLVQKLWSENNKNWYSRTRLIRHRLIRPFS